MSVIGFIIQFFVAIVAGLLLFYMPGRLFIRMLKLYLNFSEHLTIALLSGAALTTLFFWGSAVVGLSWLVWPYAVGCTLFESWYYRRYLQIRAMKIPDPDAPEAETIKSLWPLWLVTLASVLVQTRFIAWTAWPGEAGMSLLAWHGCDAPWHVYNIFQFAKQYPIDMTGFAGEALKNYHMFTDLMWGAVYKFCHVDPWHLYFRIAPFFYSALLTMTTYIVTKVWTKEVKTALIAAGLMVFSSNFGYLLPLIFQSKDYFIWDSLFWVQSPLMQLFNPGTSASFLFLLSGLWAFYKWLEEKNWSYLIMIALLWGVLPGFKVYPAILVALALVGTAFVIGVFQKNWRPFLAGIVLLPVFLLVFLPPNLNSHHLLHFLPGYNLGTMLVAPDRMALMSSDALKSLYFEQPVQVVWLMAGLVLVFVVGNLGVRLIALPKMIWQLFNLKKADPVVLIMALLSLAGLAGSVLFVQSGLRWNTIQFFYYVVLVTTIIAAKQFVDWTKRLSARTQLLLLLLLFGLGLPGVIQSLLVVNWQATIQPEVYQALTWLKNQTKNEKVTLLRPLADTVSTPEGFGKWLIKLDRGKLTSLTGIEADAVKRRKKQQSGSDLEEKDNEVEENLKIVGLEKMDSNIVEALVFQNSYLSFLDRVNIMNYPVLKRAKVVQYFYSQANVVEAREFLEQEKIKYVILFAESELPFEPQGVPLKQVFQNQEVTIYKYINSGGW